MIDDILILLLGVAGLFAAWWFLGGAIHAAMLRQPYRCAWLLLMTTGAVHFVWAVSNR